MLKTLTVIVLLFTSRGAVVTPVAVCLSSNQSNTIYLYGALNACCVVCHVVQTFPFAVLSQPRYYYMSQSISRSRGLAVENVFFSKHLRMAAEVQRGLL